LIASVLDPDPVIELGLNEPEVWFGSPMTLKLTTPLNPFKDVTATV
jgi:hypothetical protein